METRTIRISAKGNKGLQIKIIPGHFATNHSHINYYIDMTDLKFSHIPALKAAKLLAEKLAYHAQIDTIVCVDETQIIGAFLAVELSKNGIASLSQDTSIDIVSPEYNTNNQLVFRDNIQHKIWNKKVLLLLGSATTGKSISKVKECIGYYGGTVEAAAALFSAKANLRGTDVISLFSEEDLPDYKTFDHTDCPMCKAGQRMDAIVNSYGYTRL